MLNRFELIGNLTHAPELRYTAQGAPYCFLRVATNRFINNQQRTDYHFISTWNAQAERAVQQLMVGDRIFIEGRVDSPPAQGDADKERSRVRLVATRVLFLHRHRQTNSVDRGTGPANVSDLTDETRPAPEPEIREPFEELS